MKTLQMNDSNMNEQYNSRAFSCIGTELSKPVNTLSIDTFQESL